MSQWKLVHGFQNSVLNFEHLQEKEAVLHYMNPTLLSNHLFDREFPLGVEEGLMRNKEEFAIAHSGLYRVQHRQNRTITFFVYAGMISGILAFFIYLIRNMTSGSCE